ncbi:MAG: hypothetical protein K0R54_4516 [Clostridiaceae bacterium]|jgi:hypothetical protein|nr:hypothetical protein [Clostridiaceae bacterium]
MINTENGEIVIENLSYSLNQNVKRKSFERMFPEESIRNIDDIKNGYIWFNIWGGIIGKESEILLALCFNPNDEIESIHIYPYVNRNIELDWCDWSEENFNKEKIFCDKWLRENFNLNECTKFSWGTITLFSDRRSGSNGIAIKYN